MQRSAFSVVSPSSWNDLSSFLRLSHRTISSSFYALIKTTFVTRPGWGAPLNRDLEEALYKFPELID